MENLKLIYVLSIGLNWKNENLYEFIFSDTIENIDGEDWDSYPAGGNPLPPYKELIKCVGRLATDLKFDVVQNSDTFNMYDAVDGIVALAWEDISGYDEYPESRINFKFGDEYKTVKDILYSKDLMLELKEVKNVNKK